MGETTKFTASESAEAFQYMALAGWKTKGSDAGTALNAIMTRLATDTKDCASTLEEYGVYVYDTQGNMQSLSSILEGVSGVWGTLTDQQQASLAKAIAGTNHYSQLQQIMTGCSEATKETGKSFTDYTAALENCSGSADQMAGTMLDNLNGKMTLMNSALDSLKISIGNALMPALGGLADALNLSISLCPFVAAAAAAGP